MCAMPTYRIDRSYEWNYRAGPQYRGPFPRVPETGLKDFLGIPVRSRIGISAGILLNSRWIRVYARLGFDILTYKTVRSSARACYALPNWTYLSDGGPGIAAEDRVLRPRRGRPGDWSRVTSAVSFGMPSMSPAVWTRDVRRARASLPPGRVLVVSVVASVKPGDGEAKLVEDFAGLAEAAREAGAHVVEANLSCPNVTTPEGCVYHHPALARRVLAEMKRRAGGIPLLAKAGYFPQERGLRAFLRAIEGAAEGVLLINGLSRRVTDRRGRAIFGPGREVCAVIGRGIAACGLRNVEQAVRIIRTDGLSLKVLAVGGVLSPEDAAPYFDAGALAVLMGGAPMYDPLLAVRMKRAHPEW